MKSDINDNLTIVLRAIPVIVNNISYDLFCKKIYHAHHINYAKEKWDLLKKDPMLWLAHLDIDKLSIISNMVKQDKGNFFMAKFNWNEYNNNTK